jgi:hypothetical protein
LTIVGIALAVSVAVNAGLTHLYLGKRDELATQKSVTDQFSSAANSCSTSVEELKKASDARHAAVLAALAKNASAVRSLEGAANQALTTKPDDPNDLCGSLDRYLRGELDKERTTKP